MTLGSGRENPRVLIVVPTLGQRTEYLVQTLNSIRGQDELADIVVVTPPEAREAREAARRAEALVLDDPGSLSGAVNIGLAAAAPWHEFGNWLGDDDLLAPGALGRAARVLAGDAGSAVAYGHCTYIDPVGRPLWVSQAGRYAPWLLGWGPNLIPQPGMLFRIADFWELGGLDESLHYTMDLDLLLRLRRLGRLVDVGAPVSSFRWHQDSLTVSGRAASLTEAEAVKRRYLSPRGQLARHLWERPTRLATKLAVGAMARRGARAAN